MDAENPSAEILLAELSNFVSSLLGLHFPRERWRDLSRGISRAATQLGFENGEECIAWLLSNPLARADIEILASHLTVGETYFFRNPESFRFLEQDMLPPLLKRQGSEKHLRIWSAGCCTGEEPYSIAITLSKAIADLHDWNVTILGTDINPQFLRKAADGVYSDWSFRETPGWIKDRYFQRLPNGYFEIAPSIKRMVSFSYLNLAEDAFPSMLNKTNAMDIVFCRNVLMYFAPERVHATIERFYRALADRGWLLVSPTENSHLLFSQFVPVNMPTLTVYQKREELRSPQGHFWTGEFESNRHAEEAILPEVEDQPDLVETIEPVTAAAHATAPVSRDDRHQAAAALFEQGRYAEASGELRKILSTHPADGKAAGLLARVCANEGDLPAAVEWCDKAIASDKLNAGLHYLRANILQEEGDLHHAGMSLRRALYVNHEFVLAHFALGNLALAQGKVIEANKHFDNTLSLLDSFPVEQILTESEGLTAGRLREIIYAIHQQQKVA